jgi:hypothetical protein
MAAPAAARGGAVSLPGDAAASSPAARHGITVSSVTESLRPVPLTAKEPIGLELKDVLS